MALILTSKFDYMLLSDVTDVVDLKRRKAFINLLQNILTGNKMTASAIKRLSVLSSYSRFTPHPCAIKLIRIYDAPNKHISSLLFVTILVCNGYK